ncbi:putative TauD/TfdA-like domain, taurine dioxygenase TauD-like superfamily [Septoria linicola]|nr:putative TauD/TfdA-like domain, taurine dioxygenase TauD-like superfamily [Septoria linicola]
MADLQAHSHRSADTGLPTTLHPSFNSKIKAHVPPESEIAPIHLVRDRASYADPSKPSLFTAAKCKDLAESVGTLVEDIQLSQLSGAQLDELALLVCQRGVVFFRGQDLTTERQVELFQHFGLLDRHQTQTDQKYVNVPGHNHDHRETLSYTPWPWAEWHADSSFERNPPSYSMLRMESHPAVGGDTAWVSTYGLYDTLSKPMQGFLDRLHAVHTSRLQYDTLIDLFNARPHRPPVDSHHPAVRSHPVTNLRALNVNPCFVTSFAELKKKESDKLLELLDYHIHSADDHYVRWKWEAGDVAMWDNRCTLHRVIPGKYPAEQRRGIRTTVFGEKPYFDPASKSRDETLVSCKVKSNGHGSDHHKNGEMPG